MDEVAQPSVIEMQESMHSQPHTAVKANHNHAIIDGQNAGEKGWDLENAMRTFESCLFPLHSMPQEDAEFIAGIRIHNILLRTSAPRLATSFSLEPQKLNPGGSSGACCDVGAKCYKNNSHQHDHIMDNILGHVPKPQQQQQLRLLYMLHHNEQSAQLQHQLEDAWQLQPAEVFFSTRNLPPLINSHAVDPSSRGVQQLTMIADVGGNIGGVCFVVGSFVFYPQYENLEAGAALFTLGSLLFLVGSAANFAKNDAASFKDVALSVNAILYIAANSMFVVGSALFFPQLIELAPFVETTGISLFIIGSVVFILAPLFDMYRTWLLRRHLQISTLSYSIELTIAALYIGGSVLFVVGSVYFIPSLFQVFAVTMFVVGSSLFLLATASMPMSNLWRYLTRRHQQQHQRQRRQESLAEEQRKKSDLRGPADNSQQAELPAKDGGDIECGGAGGRDGKLMVKSTVVSRSTEANLTIMNPLVRVPPGGDCLGAPSGEGDKGVLKTFADPGPLGRHSVCGPPTRKRVPAAALNFGAAGDLFPSSSRARAAAGGRDKAEGASDMAPPLLERRWGYFDILEVL